MFYDIAEEVTPGYEDRGMLTMEQGKTLTERVKKYLQTHPTIQYGDLIFLGDTYETRQEQGFRLVLEDGNTLAGESAMNIPLRVVPELQRRDIHYAGILNKMKKRSNDQEEQFYDYFYGNESPEDIESDYQEKGIL
jgi:hypothetical protein